MHSTRCAPFAPRPLLLDDPVLGEERRVAAGGAVVVVVALLAGIVPVAPLVIIRHGSPKDTPGRENLRGAGRVDRRLFSQHVGIQD